MWGNQSWSNRKGPERDTPKYVLEPTIARLIPTPPSHSRSSERPGIQEQGSTNDNDFPKQGTNGRRHEERNSNDRNHDIEREDPGIQAPRPQAVRPQQTSNSERAVFSDIDPEFQELLLILPFRERRDQVLESFFHAGISTVRQFLTATDKTILALSMPGRRQREPIPKFQVRLILQLRRFASSYVEYYNGVVDIAIYTEAEFLYFCRRSYRNNISGQSVSYKANHAHSATKTPPATTETKPSITSQMEHAEKKQKTKTPTAQTRTKTTTMKPSTRSTTGTFDSNLHPKTYKDSKLTKMTASILPTKRMAAPNSTAKIPTKKAPKNKHPDRRTPVATNTDIRKIRVPNGTSHPLQGERNSNERKHETEQEERNERQASERLDLCTSIANDTDIRPSVPKSRKTPIRTRKSTSALDPKPKNPQRQASTISTPMKQTRSKTATSKTATSIRPMENLVATTSKTRTPATNAHKPPSKHDDRDICPSAPTLTPTKPMEPPHHIRPPTNKHGIDEFSLLSRAPESRSPRNGEISKTPTTETKPPKTLASMKHTCELTVSAATKPPITTPMEHTDKNTKITGTTAPIRPTTDLDPKAKNTKITETTASIQPTRALDGGTSEMPTADNLAGGSIAEVIGNMPGTRICNNVKLRICNNVKLHPAGEVIAGEDGTATKATNSKTVHDQTNARTKDTIHHIRPPPPTSFKFYDTLHGDAANFTNLLENGETQSFVSGPDVLPPSGRPPGSIERNAPYGGDIIVYDTTPASTNATTLGLAENGEITAAENGEITARRHDLVFHNRAYLALKSKSAPNGIDELPPPGRPPGSNNKNDQLTTLGNLIYTWGARKKTCRRVECRTTCKEVAYGNEELKDQGYKGSKDGEIQLHIKRRYAFLIRYH